MGMSSMDITNLKQIGFAEGRVSLVGMRLNQDCPIVNTPLRQLTELFPDLNITIVYIIRDEQAIFPRDLDQLLPGDEVYFVVDSMMVIPAVDIKNKKCVQLIQGDPNKKHVELDNPLSVAERWINEGAEMIHLVDLDKAIYQTNTNEEVIKEIIKSVSVPVQVGGGIRTVDDALNLINIGAKRVILGTSAVKNPDIIEELSSKVGTEKIMVALDAKDGKVVIKGWKEKTEYSPVEIGKILEEKGAGSILFTNVDVEGLLKGVDIRPVRELVEALNIPIIASGGITTYDDLLKLKEIGVDGVVVGSAIYKNIIDLKEAIKICR
jgi:phosphoribosylformimino-5-aminoimidazole carboxamide ribotide isomerase